MSQDPHSRHRGQMELADSWESYANSLVSTSDGAGQRYSNQRRAQIYRQAARDLRMRAERELITATRRAA